MARKGRSARRPAAICENVKLLIPSRMEFFPLFSYPVKCQYFKAFFVIIKRFIVK